jgi:hypothetical protein
MATNAQYKTRAFLLLIPFFVILWAIFMPWYPDAEGSGKVNGLTYFDNFFNSLSKGSAFNEKSQDDQMKSAEKIALNSGASTFSSEFDMKKEDQAQTAAKVLTASGLQATAEGSKVKVDGDLPTLAKQVVADSVSMYKNEGTALADKYGMDERQALYTWHEICNALNKSLTKSGDFAAAKALKNVMTKAIEPAYNYYGVQMKPVSEEMGLLAFALIFYVVYTVWYGFGIMYLFEGLGITIGH